MTSVVSGTTKLIPVMIGGAFTTPVPIATTAPPTSLVPTGTIAKSSASALSSKLNVNIIPLIKVWTNNPTKDASNNAIKAIKGILPDAENLLNSLGGDQTSTPCSKSTKRGLLLAARGLPNPIQIASDIVHSVACIDNTLNEISGAIDSGVNAVKPVLSNVDDLTSLTQNLGQQENDNQSKSDNSQSKSKNTETKSSNTHSSSSKTDSSKTTSKTTSKTSSTSKSSSSSRSCTQTSFTRDIYVKCFPTTLSGKTSQVTQTCTTSTSTVSGCKVTAFSTTTTSSGSAVMATSHGIITPDTGVAVTANAAHFSSRLAAIEANGVNGKVTGSGTVMAKSTSSKSLSSKSPTSKPAPTSKVTSSDSGKTASPASTSLSKTVSNTSYLPSKTKGSSASPTITACSFVTTVFPKSLQSMDGTGTQYYCTCGDEIAGIALGTSKFCGTGRMPTGWTQIPADPAGNPVTSTTQAPKITSTVAPPQKTSQAAPPPPAAYKTGTCSLHIYEGAGSGEEGSSISMTAEIKDGGGNSLGKTETSVEWGGAVTMLKGHSKLPYDVVITFPVKTSGSQKRSLESGKSGNVKGKKRFLSGYESVKFKRICCGGLLPTPNYAWEHRIVTIQAGDMKVDTTDTDQSKMPYMNVGAYDNNGDPPVSRSYVQNCSRDADIVV
jgi:hypothetical protein